MAKSDDIFFQVRALQQLRAALGIDGFRFLSLALGSVETLLPHLETSGWRTSRAPDETGVRSIGSERLEITLTLSLKVGQENFVVRTVARRRRAKSGLGAEEKTLAAREYDLCRQILERAQAVLKAPSGAHAQQSLRAIHGLLWNT